MKMSTFNRCVYICSAVLCTNASAMTRETVNQRLPIAIKNNEIKIKPHAKQRTHKRTQSQSLIFVDYDWNAEKTETHQIRRIHAGQNGCEHCHATLLTRNGNIICVRATTKKRSKMRFTFFGALTPIPHLNYYFPTRDCMDTTFAALIITIWVYFGRAKTKAQQIIQLRNQFKHSASLHHLRKCVKSLMVENGCLFYLVSV